MKNKIFILFVIVVCAIFESADAQKPGWAPTPPMGWNSWNQFQKNINEKVITEIADAMVSSGMRDAGYEYVVIDDCWELGRSKSAVNDLELPGRDAEGTILADTLKFPHGLKYLADYIHSRGLKFGIYTAPGTVTCGGHTGSEGFEEKDVNTFAEWGVDFIKLDWCGCSKDIREVSAKWRNALNKASRPIVLSLNVGGNNLGSWITEYGDMWRTTSDIMPIWVNDPSKFKIFPSVSDIIILHAYSPVKQAPSAWNDPDMMQVCNIGGYGNSKGLTLEESKSHFSLWAMFGAPLIAGNDLRNMKPEAIKILTNREVIGVDQDPLGLEGVMIRGQKYGPQIWAKKLLHYSDYAVLLLNNGSDSADVIFNYIDLGLKGPVFLRDLWKHEDLGLYNDPYKVKIPSHGVVMLKITANENPVKLPEFKIPEFPLEKTLEAEDALAYEAGYIANSIKGFSGNGYIMGQNHKWAGLFLIWKYLITAKGNYKVTFRYCNPGKEELSFVCNNKNVIFGPCIKGKWAETNVIISLKDGLQNITLSSSSCKKNTLALDYVVFEKADD